LYINNFIIKKYLVNGKTLTILQFFNIFYIVFIFIGSILLNIIKFDYEDYYGFYQRPDILMNIWILASSGLLLIPIGGLLINLFLGVNEISTLKNSQNDISIINNNDYSISSFYFACFLVCLSFISFFIYYSKVGNLAIFNLFSGLSPTDISVLRSDATNNFSGKYHRYQLFFKNIPNLLLIVSFFLRNKKTYWKYFFYFLIALNIFFALLNVEKTPLFKILILILLCYQVVNIKIKFKNLILFLGISLSSLIILYILVMGMEGRFIFDIISAILHRIFIGQIHPLFWWQLYLEQNGPIGFISLPNPGGIFPFQPVSLTILVFDFAHPEIAASGIQGSMPTVFFAYWMLSFGTFFAFISMLIFGITLQLFELFFILLRKSFSNVYVLALYIIMIDYFTNFIAEGFDSILFDIQWIFSLLIVIIYFFFKKIKIN
jgi:hypothetical protein